ncbi:Trypanosomal VSG domain containing protein, putative [Trypanosoma equiperdum]|uniref:Trypanosomal VSG domain containing protein, putative n=1 Tax=Trypanosoma equiperdum TaxID=5694 RepID=A0A1G4I0Y9_TRYEQ|nr:Trypanosomal VSG domain containing protein, putative [Trypanosoma equiperdum]
MATVSLISAVLLATANFCKATLTDGINAPIFTDLCPVLNWAENGVTLDVDASREEQDYMDIQKLNMILAPDKWRTKFNNNAEGKTTRTADKDHPKDEMAAQLWETWVAVANPLKETAQRDEVLEAAKLKGAPQPTRKQARQREEAAAATAYVLKRTLTAKPDPPTQNEAAEIKKPIDSAVYGKPPKGVAADFNPPGMGNPSTSRAALCETTGSNKVATLVEVAVCLCTKKNDAGTAVNEPCRHLQSGAEVAFPTATNQVLTKYNDVFKQCDHKLPAAISAAIVAATVAKLSSYFNHQTAATYLGAYITTGCSGADNTGVCVKYSDITDTDPTKTNKIGWLANLNAAGLRLRQIKTYNRKAAPLKAKLRSLRDDIYNFAAIKAALPQEETGKVVHLQPQVTALTEKQRQLAAARTKATKMPVQTLTANGKENLKQMEHAK